MLLKQTFNKIFKNKPSARTNPIPLKTLKKQKTESCGLVVLWYEY